MLNKKLIEFYKNKKNWRPAQPPSYSTIMKHMGWKYKNYVLKALQKNGLV
jgi:hypothetical protein